MKPAGIIRKMQTDRTDGTRSADARARTRYLHARRTVKRAARIQSSTASLAASR